MKSRMLFRDSGHVIRTRRGFDWGWAFAALALVLFYMGVSLWIAHGEPAARAAGYAQAQAQLSETVARAFHAGRQEGLQACTQQVSRTRP